MDIVMSAIAKGKINFFAPSDLIERANAIAKEQESTLSDFIRRAISEAIARVEQDKLDKEIRKACVGYARSNKHLAQEWKPAEARIE